MAHASAPAGLRSRGCLSWGTVREGDGEDQHPSISAFGCLECSPASACGSFFFRRNCVGRDDLSECPTDGKRTHGWIRKCSSSSAGAPAIRGLLSRLRPRAAVGPGYNTGPTEPPLRRERFPRWSLLPARPSIVGRIGSPPMTGYHPVPRTQPQQQAKQWRKRILDRGSRRQCRT